MAELAAAAWAAFTAAAATAGTAVTTALATAGVAAGTAATIGTIVGAVKIAAQVIGGVMAVSSALGIGQRKPQLRSMWEQGRLTVETSPSRKILLGRTAAQGALRAQFQTGSRRDIFTEVVALSAAGPVEAIEGLMVDRQLHTWNGTTGACTLAPNDMWVFTRDGAWAQTAISPVPGRPVQDQPTQWTTAHRGAGVAHVLWMARENPNAFPKGKPRPLWVVRGHTELVDPRTGATAAASARDNPAVWAYSWLRGLRTPVAYGNVELGGYGKTVEQIDVATYSAWANRCEAREWRVSGEIDLNEDREAVLRAICQAGGAVPITRAARDSVFYQAVKTSIGTLTEADLAGPLEVQTSPEIRDRANGLVPRFRSEAAGWEMVSGSLVSDPAYVTEDGGSRVGELTLPLVATPKQAGELAAYQVVQSRERLWIKGEFMPRVMAFLPGEAVTLDMPTLGLVGVKCIIEGRDIGPSGAISMALRSETDAKHAWAEGQTTLVPDTSLPELSDGSILAPSVGAWLAVAAQITQGAASIPVIRVTGAAESPRVASIMVRYRVSPSGPWIDLGALTRDTTRVEISTVTPATAYEVQIAYRSGVGTVSAWTGLGTVTTGTLTAVSAGIADGIVGQGDLATRNGSTLPIGGANLLVDAQMLRSLTHRAALSENVPAAPALLQLVDAFVGVFVQVRTPTLPALAGGSFYGVALARAAIADEGVVVEGGGRIGFRMGVSMAVASGAVTDTIDFAFVRFMGFRLTDGVWDTSVDVALPRVTELQSFTHVFDAPLTRRWVVAVWIRVAAGVAVRAELNVWQPGLWRLVGGQTEVPPWSESVSADRRADVTAANTAAAITGQGPLATASLTPAQVQGRFLGSFASEADAVAAGLQDGDTYIDTGLNALRGRSPGGTTTVPGGGGPPAARAGQATVTGIGVNSGTWTTAVSVTLGDVAAGLADVSQTALLAVFGTTAITGVGDFNGEWRIRRAGTVIASGTWVATDTGGGVEVDPLITAPASVAAGAATYDLQLRRASGTTTISGLDARLYVSVTQS